MVSQPNRMRQVWEVLQEPELWGVMATTDDRREVELFIRIENVKTDSKEFEQWVREIVYEAGYELDGGEIISSYGVREVKDGQDGTAESSSAKDGDSS